MSDHYNKDICGMHDLGAMLNAYPDSVGQNLNDMVSLLQKPELKDSFKAFYILPSVFNTDLDRGFSVIDYDLNQMLATEENFENFKKLGIALKLDFVLNHASVLSAQFRDILTNGSQSVYADFFIDWNKFWEGYGSMTDEGYIQPDEEYLRHMFFRKPGLPILSVNLPDGATKFLWNTFYQEVRYDHIDAHDLVLGADMQYAAALKLAEQINNALDRGDPPEKIDFGSFIPFRNQVLKLLRSRCKYLGQIDLNIKSPLVWDYYRQTLKRLAAYGAAIIRLDAFAYAPKAPGTRNFLNDPETWELLSQIREIADADSLTLLPEIHSEYHEKTHEKLAQNGYMTYDFFLPGLIIHALEKHTPVYLHRWIRDIQAKGIAVVNMLGSHDGIPLLDLRGLLPNEEIDEMIKIIVARGGYVKDLHGNANMYYQVNATYYSALGEDDRKMLLARAIQLFMPGKPQVWYLDLFCGKNDHEAVMRAGVGGHKEINRTNLTSEQVEAALSSETVKAQLEMLRFRNTFAAFDFDSELFVESPTETALSLRWQKQGYTACLTADLHSYEYSMTGTGPDGSLIFQKSTYDRR